MVKSAPKAPMSYEKAAKLASKRVKKMPMRIAKTASGPALSLTGVLFANAFDEAVAQRDATERMQAAARIDPLVHAGQLIVPVDGLVSLYTRDIIIRLLHRILASPIAATYINDDLEFAMRCPDIFWNVVYHVGGAAAVRTADGSVVKACNAHLILGTSHGGVGGEAPDRRRKEQNS